MRRLRDQILLSLVVALAVAVVLANAESINAREGRRTEPYRTQRDMLLLAFTVYPDRAPEIQETAVVPEGRITVLPPGEHHYRLEAEDGAILFEQPFQANFFLTTHPPVDRDRIDFT